MKRFAKIMIVGVCLGLVLLLVKIAFQIPENVFWWFYVVLSGITIVGISAFNVAYNLYYQKKMKTALQLLKAGQVESYIAEVESMRSRAKGRFANNMLTINLSAGYCNLKQYDKAAELLERLSDVKLPGVYRLIHRINLCNCYFYRKQADRVISLYESSGEIFAPYRNNKLYGGHIALMDIFAAVSRKDAARAAELLQTARSTWDDSQFLEDYRYLEEHICQMERGRN